MSALPFALALQLAASCAPSLAPETLLSVVRTESGFDALAVGDNTAARSYRPATLAEAVTLATRLATAGHNLDLGAAQLNWSSGHLQRRGLPLAAAFDPCTGLRVGGEVLADCYRRTSGPDEQARLRQALSCYNTGTLDRGTAYAGRVLVSARYVVPAIRVQGALPASPLPASPSAPPFFSTPFVRPQASRSLVFTPG